MARQITISAHMQEIILIYCQGTGLLTNANHHNFVEHQCSITAQGVITILTGKPFYVYFANLTAKSVNLKIFMTIVIASNAPIIIVYD